ncbi:methionine synthase [Crassaminicella thermophila]|uniref:Methionine synthase n=1 Tax=Crassaminicella thermophila TaxID=2599308 RepID=A0A5C0SE44_CRATE|nr:vitamin B12 dependent-methionine synthase activation domain-containing protein [Crassaminicella thermophila]QEK12875.1 methionine synthase [Crassaminicella thermophila]
MYIDKKEVLRYLGYHSKKIDTITNEIIDTCIEEIKEIANFNYVYRIFPIEKKDKKIFLEGTSLIFESKNLYAHLLNSKKCALLAVTLGNIVDQKIRYYSKINLSKSLIFDAVATTAIESICDEIEENIKIIAKKYGLHITNRYSPGYGDFPLSYQPKIIHLLDAQKKIGLTATPDFILIPRKSVTAIIGLEDKPSINKLSSCAKCSQNRTCIYKKDGDTCEYKKNNR